MRSIAHVISTPEGIGGAERVMLALLREGARRGWRQEVLDPFDVDPNGSALASDIRAIEGVDYRAVSTRRVREFPAARRWLQRKLDRLDPDLVHVHLFHALALTASLPRGRRVTLATHHHGDYLRVAGRRLEERIDQWAVGRMDHVVACSGWVRQFLTSRYGCSPSLITTIPNGWEGRLPEERTGHDRNMVLCVAHFRREKDHRTLIEAFSIVAERLPEARLVLVGGGPLRDQIEDRVVSLGLGDVVSFVGPVDDVWPYYAQAGVLVLPSLAETLGIAALEAMAASVPVVATSVGGIPEIVTHGENGLLVPPEDPSEMAETIEALLRDQEMARRMGSAGRDVAGSRRMSAAVDRYFELYDRLLET